MNRRIAILLFFFVFERGISQEFSMLRKPLVYGEIYMDSSVLAQTIESTWTKITDFTSNGNARIDYFQDTFWILIPGLYLVEYDLKASSTINNSEFETGMPVNGEEPEVKNRGYVKFESPGAIEPVYRSFTKYYEKGDYLVFVMRQTVGVQADVTFRYGNIIIMKL